MKKKCIYFLLSLGLYSINYFVQAESFTGHREEQSCQPPFVDSFHAAMSNSSKYSEKNANTDSCLIKIRKLYDTYAVQNLGYISTPRIPKIIHQIWLGSPFPEKYIYFQNTWRLHHPDWKYILWTEKEIEEFGLVNKEAYDESTNYGQKSDIARYEILYRMGGLYVDTDFECLKNFEILHHCFDFYAGTEYGTSFYAFNGLIASVPGNKILKKCIDTINIHVKHSASLSWNILHTTGPLFFSDCIRKLINDPEIGRCVIFPVNYFYPWPYFEADKGYEENKVWIRPETFAMHHWHVSWNNGDL